MGFVIQKASLELLFTIPIAKVTINVPNKAPGWICGNIRRRCGQVGSVLHKPTQLGGLELEL